ncbi:MAG: hypothetical protein BGO12_16020 [Verrucomicrobia bacterium 61-8]|nr:MAG: hypothetical protein BGO12_16020 [Verrucomicrobia bacterium 61-8]
MAIMILVLALVMGILSRVTTERSAAGGYASSVGAKLLADTAVQLVQAQIDAATSGGTTVAWSSQPGLIRTFDEAGRPAKSFKLYSDGTMQVTGALNPAMEVDALKNWYASPGVFTDINSPVDANFDGTPDMWPILDPSAEGKVEGFEINSAPKGSYLGVNNPAPMPVRWLYVLEDGQVVAPDASSSGNLATISGASKDNPIVGRIAFWTDDETCKLNVNTASEGAYWDVPKFNTVGDQNLGIYQPVKNEFQGYPGHPAGVNLSTVFSGLASGGAATQYDEYYKIAPRIDPGGSLNLTRPATDALEPVKLDQDRLYADIDELIFDNSRNPGSSLKKEDIERGKFFLTAVSRAPEVNLFNLPRVVCWPIHTDVSRRSPFDKLIAFCGTLNGDPYYFQRKDKDSSTNDYQQVPRNKTLYSYLKELTSRPVPGFGGNLKSKFGADHGQVLTEIFDYIRNTNLNDLNFTDKTKQFAPGTGEAGVGMAEVVPIEIDDTRGFGRYVTFPEVAVWLICTADPDFADSNDPVTNRTLVTGKPLEKNTADGTKELRIEAALILDPFTPMHGSVPMHPDIEVTIDGLENWTIRGNEETQALNLGFPSLGRQVDADAGVYRFGPNSEWAGGKVNAGGNIGANWAFFQRQVRARNGGRLPKDANFSDSVDGSGVKNQQYPFVSEPVTVKVAASNPKVTLAGSTLTINVKQRTTGDTIQTIKLNFPSTTMPVPALPRPTAGASPLRAPAWSFQGSGAGAGYVYKDKGRLNTLDEKSNDAKLQPVIDRANDVIHSVVASEGTPRQTLDPRLLAMMKDVPSTVYESHPKSGTARMAHTVIADAGSGFGGYTTSSGNSGTFADFGAGKTYPFNYQPAPKLPFPVDAARVSGDWDNGIGNLADGGFLNEPDQGNLAALNSPSSGFGYAPPYYSGHNKVSTFSMTFTSPARIMPSPGMFGSLPTGFKRGLGWQTLLFRRQPTHPGYAASNGSFINNPDYLLMDLFWMPVVEPYAISEPLSTAGKINMNTQIIPFTYIRRDTGIYAALENERVISVPTADYNSVYKDAKRNFTDKVYRHPVNLAGTLKQFQQRFDNSDGTGLFAFRAAAEICDLHIIPDDATIDTSSRTTIDAGMAGYWASRGLTGDNSRERVYTTVYQRLTTKSNTYTVHFRAQSLRKRAGSAANTWDEGKDVITGDYRGSTVLERFVDSNNTAIPDFASNVSANLSLDSFYRWRMRSHRTFAP